MSGKQRNLPSWMTSTSVNREREEKDRRRSKRKDNRSARVTLYWMNEQELVQTAVSLLAEVTNQEHVQKSSVADEKLPPNSDGVMGGKVLETEAMEETSDCDACVKLHVSEADMDIAEVETLPYISNMQRKDRRQGSNTDCDLTCF